jgi:hypothetical protein
MVASISQTLGLWNIPTGSIYMAWFFFFFQFLSIRTDLDVKSGLFVLIQDLVCGDDFTILVVLECIALVATLKAPYSRILKYNFVRVIILVI